MYAFLYDGKYRVEEGRRGKGRGEWLEVEGFVKGGRIIKLLIIYMEGNYVKMRLFDFLLYAALNHNLKRFSIVVVWFIFY